jgi:hypothetical protein
MSLLPGCCAYSSSEAPRAFLLLWLCSTSASSCRPARPSYRPLRCGSSVGHRPSPPPPASSPPPRRPSRAAGPKVAVGWPSGRRCGFGCQIVRGGCPPLPHRRLPSSSPLRSWPESTTCAGPGMWCSALLRVKTMPVLAGADYGDADVCRLPCWRRLSGKLCIPPISCVLQAKALIQFLDRTTAAAVTSLPPLGRRLGAPSPCRPFDVLVQPCAALCRGLLFAHEGCQSFGGADAFVRSRVSEP